MLDSAKAYVISALRSFVACLPENDDFISRYVYRWLGIPGFMVATRVGLRANHVTAVSMILGVTGALCFLIGSYGADLLGVVLLNLALALDSVDGQVARFRGEASEFGRLLDSLSDVIKLIAIYICLSVGAYSETGETIYLVLGMVGLSHLFLAYYLMVLNKRFSFYRYPNAVSLSSTRWIGLESSLYVLISAFLLFRARTALLVAFAIAGAGPWIILMVRAWQSAQKVE